MPRNVRQAIVSQRPVVEVLLSTMNKPGIDFLDLLGIQSAALIVNQADRCAYEEAARSSGLVRMLTLPERGIGLSRTTALQRASGEFCLFADDDIRLSDRYPTIISEAFAAHPNADIIAFNLDGGGDFRRKTESVTKIGRWNYMAFGAPRIAVRLQSIQRARVSFSLEFGGGTGRGAGEDTLFLRDCLRSGLTIVAVPDTIGALLPSEEVPSSWFKGFDDAYFRDRGALYAATDGLAGYLMAAQFAWRRRAMFSRETSPFVALRHMVAGARTYRQSGSQR